MTEAKDNTRPSILAAVPTPFTAAGRVDTGSAAELFAAVASSGVDGMFVAGTTGEFPTLSLEERKVLVELSLEKGGNVDVFPHVGAASVWEASQLTTHAIEVGADRVAAITPYYFPAGDAELEEYYRRVAEVADGREVYGYSIPAVAKNQISGALLNRLRNIPNFVGVKVSIPGAEIVRELVGSSGGTVRIYSGSDATALEGLRAGAYGLVSGPSSAIPGPYVALADAVAVGDTGRITQAWELIRVVARDIGGDIGLIKLALEIQGIPGGHLRASLPRPSPEDQRRVEKVIELVVETLGSTRVDSRIR